MSVSVTLSTQLEEFLREQAHRQGVSVEALLSRTIEERWSAMSRAPRVSAQETELLLRLQNISLSESTREYVTLCRRSDDGSLMASERERLLELIEQRDLQHADRLEILGKLAQLRGVSLREVMAEFKIGPE